MTYGEALDYLYANLPMFQRVGAPALKPNLHNILKLCAALGNPQKKFTSIHVAGTNGKGSVSHLLSSVLQSAGFRTGLFTSPHLVDFRERVRLNGEKIPHEKVVAFVEQNQELLGQIKPSFFEMNTALAFLHFAEENADFAVIETGLGGRLDSTNIITPALSIITNISYDHKDLLGDTLEQIAGEKAGIIKYNVPVVIGRTQPETEHVFTKTALEKSSQIFFADQQWQIEVLGQQNYSLKVKATPKEGAAQELLLGLSAKRQTENLATVLEAVNVLRQQDIEITDSAVTEGVLRVREKTGLRGRWELLQTRPLVYCDVAHNEDGIKYIAEQLKETPHHKLHFVFGVVKDKDLGPVLNLLPKDAVYYFCGPQVPRALPGEELTEKAHAAGLKGQCFSTVPTAYLAAVDLAEPGDLVLISGSTFVVADLLEYLEKKGLAG